MPATSETAVATGRDTPPRSTPRAHRMGWVGLLGVGLLALAACGGGADAPAADAGQSGAGGDAASDRGAAPGDESMGRFTLRFEGALTGELTEGSEGRSFYLLDASEGYCAATASAPMADGSEELRSVILYFGGTSCPSPGTYTVVPAQTSTPGEVWMLLSIVGPAYGAFNASSGTVEVLASTGTELRFSIAAEMASAVVPGETTRISGDVAAIAQFVIP